MHISCHPEPMCNRTWDGWLCWDDTKAGVVSEQHCPDYFQDFDPSGMIYCAFAKKKSQQAFVICLQLSCFAAYRDGYKGLH